MSLSPEPGTYKEERKVELLYHFVLSELGILEAIIINPVNQKSKGKTVTI